MAMDMFLELNGVEGETKMADMKDKKAMDILAWSWGVSNSGTFHGGGGGGAGKANVQDISITKYIDSATPKLLAYAGNGTHVPDGTLTVRKAGGDQEAYLTFKFTNLLVTALSTGGSGGEDRLTENISLNFEKVEIEYFAQGADGIVSSKGVANMNPGEGTYTN